MSTDVLQKNHLKVIHFGKTLQMYHKFIISKECVRVKHLKNSIYVLLQSKVINYKIFTNDIYLLKDTSTMLLFLTKLCSKVSLS